MCPGFGQDRVNFHQNPGRDTAKRADPTWPNRAGYSIPCAIMLGSGWGEVGGSNSLATWEHVAAVGESCSLRSTVLFCVFSLSVSLLLLLFPLFAVLLNYPYPDPPVSACFFLFSSTPQRGDGQPHGAFVAGRSQTITAWYSSPFFWSPFFSLTVPGALGFVCLCPLGLTLKLTPSLRLGVG